MIEKQTYTVNNLSKGFEKVSLDSFFYNINQKIIETKHYVKDSMSFSFNGFTKYNYNNGSFLESSIYSNNNDTLYINKYYWEKGNLIKLETYTKSLKLLREQYFEYDSMKNPFFKLNHQENLMLSQNNQISSKMNDFTGLIEVSYPPKITEMCYNSEGFLTKMIRGRNEIHYIYRNL